MTEKRKIKILQVTDTLGMGGAETWLMEVLRLWSKNETGQMDFLLTSGNEGIFDSEARQLGAKLYYLPYRRRLLPAFARELRRILRRERYDAIHDHESYVSGWHFLIGGQTLPPVRVTHVHNPVFQVRHNYGVTLSRRIATGIGMRMVARYATHITGTSRQAITEHGFDAPQFRSVPKAALHCGFDPARFLGDSTAAKESVCREFGWPVDTKIVLFAGRMDLSPDLGHPQNHKNSGFAVDVGIECVRKDSQVGVLFAGKSSPAVPVLEQRIAAAGAAGRIKFIGMRNDIECLMLGSDVLLFPSRGEGLGMVAVEAQAAGLPVLASSTVPRECVVMPELVRFRAVEDGAKAWAAELLELAARPRDVLAANQSVARSDFAIENSARALVKLYSEGSLPQMVRAPLTVEAPAGTTKDMIETPLRPYRIGVFARRRTR